MAKISIISVGMAGVDLKTNPLFLPPDRLAGATNMSSEEGVISTRCGIRYHDLGMTGQFQGANVYSPSRGISHLPFGEPYTALVTVVGKKAYYNLSIEEEFSCEVEIKGQSPIGSGEVHIFQAENYLIVQCPFSNTLWWEGHGEYIESPGLDADPDIVERAMLTATVNSRELPGANIDCCFQKINYCDVTPDIDPDEEFSSHDTFIAHNHRNFLINSAGIGIYTNGRILQQSPTSIYVSDIIHKRGTRTTEDILLMEEQQAGSFGEPLTVRSSMGQLRAMEVLPDLNAANGEGPLVAYYDFGVVAFNTSSVPRETKFDGRGNITQQGWSEIRQSNYLLNRVSATGRYSVAVMPRDHAFRSRYGIHLLKTSIGEGTFNDEFTNTLSQDVQPILDNDPKDLLKGVTAGHWTGGNRLLVSVGMVESSIYSATPFSRGFVVWNQATTFTEDRTPRPLWEGLWTVHDEIFGIHRLIDVTGVSGKNQFGFVASKRDNAALVFGELDEQLTHDVLCNEPVDIEWDVTSRKVFQGFGKYVTITDGRLEVEATGKSSRARVMIRTDRHPEWELWKESKTSSSTDREIISIQLGKPPEKSRESSWFQLRVEGIGYTEILELEAEVSEGMGKMGKVISDVAYSLPKKEYFRFNENPVAERWNLE